MYEQNALVENQFSHARIDRRQRIIEQKNVSVVVDRSR